MGSCTDPIGTSLPDRLRAHALVHDEFIPHDAEQAQWAADLREAANWIERTQDFLGDNAQFSGPPAPLVEGADLP